MNDNTWVSIPTISLRDYFAAKAMQAVLSRQDTHGDDAKELAGAVAITAYAFADAMLSHREQANG